MAVREKLGTGIYSVSEAAIYARVSSQKMTRWVFGTSDQLPILTPQYGRNDERVVSFLDFIQTLAIREIRINKHISPNKIRQALDYAKTRHGMEYPFAMRNYTFWSGNEIIICPDQNDEHIIQASGKGKGQRLMKFMWLHMDKLSFDATTSLCNSYQIHAAYGTTITMNPKVRFGEPMLPCGYSASAIWDAIHVEGGPDEAAKAYDMPLNEAMATYSFYVDHIGQMAA
ncbi:MAG TPA: hypothetical protein VGJ05_07035 [Fimbriiglobus sp.]|jgi:uncharacterized protein (DUF433 family)